MQHTMMSSGIELDGWYALGTAFVIGLTGGAGHCTLMCGGFVVAARDALAQGPGAKAWRWFQYHAGRVVTYTILALALGLAGQSVGHWVMPGNRGLWRYIVAGVLLLQVVRIVWPGAVQARVWQPVARLIARPFKAAKEGRRFPVFAAGLAWGLLPCGLSWSIIVAASSQPLWLIPLVVGAFGLGTSVALTAAQGLLEVTARKYPGLWRWSSATLLAVYAVLLVVMPMLKHAGGHG